jgi:hypothetical protein
MSSGLADFWRKSYLAFFMRFIDLKDAPSSYVGQAGKTPAVKSTEDGLQFVSPGGINFLELADNRIIYETADTGGWKEFDASSYVPAGSKGVILGVTSFLSGLGMTRSCGVFIMFRKKGYAGTDNYACYPCVQLNVNMETAAGEGRNQTDVAGCMLVVPISTARIFEYRVLVTYSGTGSTTFYLLNVRASLQGYV